MYGLRNDAQRVLIDRAMLGSVPQPNLLRSTTRDLCIRKLGLTNSAPERSTNETPVVHIHGHCR